MNAPRLFPLVVTGFLQASLLAAEAPGPVIPPGSEKAKEALDTSPRHGEYVDVAMPDGGKPIRTWVVYPERKDKAPVVIVIHEIFGLADWIRAVSDSLAADGFIALAPDLLSGIGPGGGGTSSVASGKSATIGFCWGGAASFAYATVQPGLDAAVVYYGTSPDPSALAGIKAP